MIGHSQYATYIHGNAPEMLACRAASAGLIQSRQPTLQILTAQFGRFHATPQEIDSTAYLANSQNGTYRLPFVDRFLRAFL